MFLSHQTSYQLSVFIQSTLTAQQPSSNTDEQFQKFQQPPPNMDEESQTVQQRYPAMEKGTRTDPQPSPYTNHGTQTPVKRVRHRNKTLGEMVIREVAWRLAKNMRAARNAQTKPPSRNLRASKIAPPFGNPPALGSIEALTEDIREDTRRMNQLSTELRAMMRPVEEDDTVVDAAPPPPPPPPPPHMDPKGNFTVFVSQEDRLVASQHIIRARKWIQDVDLEAPGDKLVMLIIWSLADSLAGVLKFPEWHRGLESQEMVLVTFAKKAVGAQDL